MKRILQKLPKLAFGLIGYIGLIGVGVAECATRISPEEMPWLAFFGLTYLFWLLLALIGLIHFLSRGKWWNVGVFIFALLFTGDLTKRSVGFSSGGKEGAEEQSLSVMSYNVRLFDLYNWTDGKSTRNDIFDFLKANPVDVICFQEFYHTDREGVFDTRDTLIKFLPNTHIHERYTHQMNGKQYFGVATFSKYPIVGKGELEFATDVNNFCIYIDIKKEGETIRVYNAHLASIRLQDEDYQAIEDGPALGDAKRLLDRMKSAYVKRASQSRMIAEHMAQSPYPVILCGDFNDTPVSYNYEQLISNDMVDAFEVAGRGIGSTHIGAYPFFRIDYVLHSEFFETEHFETHDVTHSDHRPVEAYLTW